MMLLTILTIEKHIITINNNNNTEGVSMTFNLSRLTLVSVSVLSLAVLNGCSNLGEEFNSATQSLSQNSKQPIVNSIDPYDSYYGNVRRQNQQAGYSPRIVRKVTKPVFKTTAPKRYVVKKGDTLWGISNKFLNNPGYWPEIWDVNQKVQNPHLIYPGDILHIYEGGRRRIKMSDGSVVEKMVPQMRIERKGGGEPISTLAPFLVWPRVLDADTIKNAPYIVNGENANLLMEKDQTVYIKNLADRHAGGRYAIFNVGKMLADPETSQEYGHEVKYTGFLEVERPALNMDVATATISESIREIRRGDRLLWIEDETHTLDVPIQIPKIKVRGSIISLFDAELIAGQTRVITINQGARNGIKLGYTLGVFTRGKTVDDPIEKTKSKYVWEPVVPTKVNLPPARVATAIVYKVLGDISYALVTESTHSVKNGYKIGNP